VVNLKKTIWLILIIYTIIFPISVIGADTSRSSIVMDLDSGRILYEKNSHQKRLVASTTKILTAITTIEKMDLDKQITVGEEVLKMYGTNIYIEIGEKITIKDLLYGLLLRSGNDAAVALAVAVSGSEENFVKLMNEKAQEIGMKDSIFQNPHGLDEKTKNYSTAYDMALLSQYAYQNKTYREIVGTKKYIVSTGNKTYLWYNRNKLLSSYKYCTGGKNGYTPSAGKTLVTTASKNNLNLTVVTLNDGNIYNTHQYLYEEMFHKYQNYKIIDKNEFYMDQSFYNGTLYLNDSFFYPLSENELDEIKTRVSISNNQAEGQVGNIFIYLGNQKIGDIPIYRKKVTKNISWLSKIRNLFTRKS